MITLSDNEYIVNSEYELQVMSLDNGVMFYYYEHIQDKTKRVFITSYDMQVKMECTFEKFWDVCNSVYSDGNGDEVKLENLYNKYDILKNLKSI